jgi:hypothetical protein
MPPQKSAYTRVLRTKLRGFLRAREDQDPNDVDLRQHSQDSDASAQAQRVLSGQRHDVGGSASAYPQVNLYRVAPLASIVTLHLLEWTAY